MKFKVLGKRLVISPAKPEEKTKGGLIIPELAQGKDPLAKGTVVAVGNMVGKDWVDDVKIKVGNSVIYVSSSVTPIKHGEEECLLVDEEYVVAIL